MGPALIFTSGKEFDYGIDGSEFLCFNWEVKLVISANLNGALNYFIHIFCNFLQIINSCCSPVSFCGGGDGMES